MHEQRLQQYEITRAPPSSVDVSDRHSQVDHKASIENGLLHYVQSSQRVLHFEHGHLQLVYDFVEATLLELLSAKMLHRFIVHDGLVLVELLPLLHGNTVFEHLGAHFAGPLGVPRV